jgi:RNA polymerase sigma factor (sigma-70 family)
LNGPDGIDEGLARDAKRGSTTAFESLVRRNQALVRGFLRRLCGNQALADDLAQETFVAAWQKLGLWDGRGTFRGWLCRIAYSRFLQDRRADQRRIAREDAVIQDAETLTDPTPAADARLDLAKLLAGLKPDEQAVLALCYGEGMSHQEIADALELPLGTVKSHVIRGRQRVLAQLQGGQPNVG